MVRISLLTSPSLLLVVCPGLRRDDGIGWVGHCGLAAPVDPRALPVPAGIGEIPHADYGDSYRFRPSYCSPSQFARSVTVPDRFLRRAPFSPLNPRARRGSASTRGRVGSGCAIRLPNALDAIPATPTAVGVPGRQLKCKSSPLTTARLGDFKASPIHDLTPSNARRTSPLPVLHGERAEDRTRVRSEGEGRPLARIQCQQAP